MMYKMKSKQCHVTLVPRLDGEDQENLWLDVAGAVGRLRYHAKQTATAEVFSEP